MDGRTACKNRKGTRTRMFCLERYVELRNLGFEKKNDKLFVEMTEELIKIIVGKLNLKDFKIKINRGVHSSEILFSSNFFLIKFTHGILDSFLIEKDSEIIFYKWNQLLDFEEFLNIIK